jgi:alpha 1,3-glucosidase
MSGGALLVRPVTTKGATSAPVYLPGAQPWYDVFSGAKSMPGDVTVDAPIDKVPVFQRGGTIIPRQMRLRRASPLMARDPYTLVIAPDASGGANGKLFLDDGDGYGYRAGDYHYREYVYAAGVLSSAAIHASDKYTAPNKLERVEVIGVPAPTKVTLTSAGQASELTFYHAADTNRLIIRKPDVPMAADWTITLA